MAMILCPNCNHKEFSGALFCSSCGAQLASALEKGSTTNIYKTIPDSPYDRKPAPFPTPPSSQADSWVALKILATEEILFLNNREEFSLGRAASGQPLVPDIDLTPHEAYEAGVSRLHASINIKKHPVMLQDLGSVNGTRINGKRIEALAPKPVKNGDILTLGKMKIQILVKE